MLNKKGRNYYVWFGSYALLIVLSILVNLIGYFVSIRIVREELLKNNSSALEQVQQSCDNYLTDMKNTAQSLYFNSDASSIQFPDYLDPQLRQGAIDNTVAQIRRYLESYHVIYDAKLLIKSQQLCVGADGALSIDDAFARGYSAYYASQAEWTADVFNAENGRFKILEQEGKPRRLLYMETSRKEHPDYGGVVQNPDYKMAVILEVNYNLLNERLREYKDSWENDFYIISNADVIAFGTAAGSELSLSRDSDGGVNIESLDSGRTLVSRPSNIGDITYICSIANEAYMGRLYLVTGAFVASYLLCTLLCGALAVWFSRRNWAQQVIMETKLSDKDSRLRENLLSQILLGQVKFGSGRLLTMLENDLPLVGKYFAVVLFEPLADQPDGTPREPLPETVTTIFTRLVRESATVQHCRIGSAQACVLCFFEERRSVSYLVEKVKAVQEFLGQSGPFLASISQLTDDVSQLALLYEQAADLMGYEFLENDQTVFVYHDEVHSTGQYTYDADMEKQLSQLLLVGDEKGAQTCIRAIVEEHVKRKNTPVSLLRILLMELVGTLLRAAAQFDKDETLDYRPLYEAVMQMVNIRQLSGIVEQICTFAGQLCALSETNKETFVMQRSQSVQQYVQENYADNNLNVNIIAEHFGITPSYMSRCFKEETGETLTDYIVRFRIEKAKLLLRGFDKNVSQIAAAVGFGSSAVFIRAFKRYEGITPTQFRSYFTGGKNEA